MKRIVAAVAIVLAFAPAWRASAYESIAVSSGGTIAGTVTYDGVAPKPTPLKITRDQKVCAAAPHFSQELAVGAHGGIRNAIVSIPGIDKGAALEPEKGVKFDQRGCVFEPHVLAFPAESTIEILNSDDIMHDLRTFSTANPPLNLIQPRTVKSIVVKIEKPEMIKVGCYMHPWMRAWWYAAGNPYYAVTGADGKFELRDVPPGTYTLKVWQEKLGERTRTVTVRAGQTATVDFKLKPGASAPAGAKQ
jgi:Carboxypeptidase regulatory-like domain